MKKYIVIHKLLIIGTLVLLANTSCKEGWLEPQPLSFFTPENTLVSESGFNSALPLVPVIFAMNITGMDLLSSPSVSFQ